MKAEDARATQGYASGRHAAMPRRTRCVAGSSGPKPDRRNGPEEQRDGRDHDHQRERALEEEVGEREAVVKKRIANASGSDA